MNTPTVPTFTPPRCTFLTGPGGAGKAQWLERRIAWIHAQQPQARCAVLLADERLTRTTRFADASPKVEVRCLFLPCLCCPQVADLPRVARAFAESTRAEWLFIEIPAIAATGLIAEFDHAVAWPREVVVCLSAAWTRARKAQTLSLFQTRLLELADRLVESPITRAESSPGDEAPALSLL